MMTTTTMMIFLRVKRLDHLILNQIFKYIYIAEEEIIEVNEKREGPREKKEGI